MMQLLFLTHTWNAIRFLHAGGPDYTAPSRNLALELVRVTEAAALAAARW
jgi:hypothetical protein